MTGKEFKRIRLDNDLSQVTMAGLLKIGLRTLGRIERGRKVDFFIAYYVEQHKDDFRYMTRKKLMR